MPEWIMILAIMAGAPLTIVVFIALAARTSSKSFTPPPSGGGSAGNVLLAKILKFKWWLVLLGVILVCASLGLLHRHYGLNNWPPHRGDWLNYENIIAWLSLFEVWHWVIIIPASLLILALAVFFVRTAFKILFLIAPKIANQAKKAVPSKDSLPYLKRAGLALLTICLFYYFFTAQFLLLAGKLGSPLIGVLVILLALGAAAAVKWSPNILGILLILIIGVGLYNGIENTSVWTTSGWRTQTASFSCPGEIKPYDFDASNRSRVVNPGGHCNIGFTVIEGEISVIDFRGNKAVYPTGPNTTTQTVRAGQYITGYAENSRAVSIQAVSTIAKVDLILCRPPTISRNWVCS